MNKRFGIIVVTALVIVAGMFFWWQPEQDDKSSELRVGVILPLTGPSAYIGNSIKNGMVIAVEEFNAQASKPFSLRVEYSDTSGQPAKVVSSWQALAVSLSPQAMIAVQEGVKGLIPLAAEQRRVLLATSVPDNGIAGVNPWTFRFFINARTDAATIARYAVEKLNKRRFGVIYVNDSMGISYRDSFQANIRNLGGEIVVQQAYEPAATDFRAQVLRIKQANPEAVYLIGYGKSLATIPIQLKENGVEATLLSVGTISQPEIMKAAGSSVEGCYYTTSAFSTFAPATPELKAFVAAYQAKFGQVPVFFEVFGYDALRLLLHAAVQGGLNPEAIRSALAVTKNLPLAVGKVSVRADGDVQFPVVVKMIKNGTWANAVP